MNAMFIIDDGEPTTLDDLIADNRDDPLDDEVIAQLRDLPPGAWIVIDLGAHGRFKAERPLAPAPIHCEICEQDRPAAGSVHVEGEGLEGSWDVCAACKTVCPDCGTDCEPPVVSAYGTNPRLRHHDKPGTSEVCLFSGRPLESLP